jgi:hypothetical protein
MEIRLCKICGIGSDINKFKMKNDKICAKKCLKCTSSKNNERLKENNYYTKYYIEHKETFIQREARKNEIIKEANRLKKIEKLAKIEKEKLDQEIKPKIRRTRKIKQHIELEVEQKIEPTI